MTLKQRLTTAVAVTGAVALLLTGCAGGSGANSGSTGGEDATIRIGSLYEPVNLSNTTGGGQGVTEALTGNVYESLYKLTDDGDTEPLLATGYEVSEDGLTYTYTLRDDVAFHSGKALTSEDVKASVEAVLAPDSQSARKSSLEVIESIDTPDEHTVVFTLHERSISLPYLLSYVWIVNSEVDDIENETDGTGPYT